MPVAVLRHVRTLLITSDRTAAPALLIVPWVQKALLLIDLAIYGIRWARLGQCDLNGGVLPRSRGWQRKSSPCMIGRKHLAIDMGQHQLVRVRLR